MSLVVLCHSAYLEKADYEESAGPCNTTCSIKSQMTFSTDKCKLMYVGKNESQLYIFNDWLDYCHSVKKMLGLLQFHENVSTLLSSCVKHNGLLRTIIEKQRTKLSHYTIIESYGAPMS